MSQHDLNIANADGATVRADINNALTALGTCSSGATAPATTFAFQFWADTANDLLKQRNAANSAWINILTLSTGYQFAAATQAEMEAGTETALKSMSPLRVKQAITALATSSADGLFYKADPSTVAFTKLSATTAEIKAGTKVWKRSGSVKTFATATAITMPSLTTGTDYAIYVCDDDTIRADASFSAPSGYTTANSRKIGGFHYAPGGNAAAQAGGDTTPAINAYSFWDLKFKPACPDPRGMTLVADSFWSDIYLLNTEHLTNGTSKYNVLMADGNSLPKKPLKFGGNGTTTQANGDWWNMNEVLQSHGKRQPTYDEFAALAYGTTEASSVGSDQVNTVLNATYTSRWGVVQSTGVMWIWGGEFGGGAAAAGWAANTGGRGSTYQMENAVLFGGAWGATSNSGSRASFWASSPTASSSEIGVRGVSDHLILD